MWALGLDLGQVCDPSALAAVEQRKGTDAAGHRCNAYAVRGLKRWPLGTPYPKIASDIAGDLTRWGLTGKTMATDATGVGRAVVDLLRHARVPAFVWPVTVTAGHEATHDLQRAESHVPKKDLVAVIQAALQGRLEDGRPRLTIAETLPDAALLAQELQDFRVKITPALNETFGAWREGAHDDLVFAVALAVWWLERSSPAGSGALPRAGGPTLISQAPPGVFGPAGGRPGGFGGGSVFEGPSGGWH